MLEFGVFIWFYYKISQILKVSVSERNKFIKKTYESWNTIFIQMQSILFQFMISNLPSFLFLIAFLLYIYFTNFYLFYIGEITTFLNYFD